MVRSQLLQKICNLNPNLLRKDLEKIIDIIFYEMENALCNDKNVEIRGFGTYKVKNRNARVGRNPKNSKLVQIPQKKAIRWKMSKVFFKKLNKSFVENKISDTY
tara:strand:- start:452 stop:763 length:312 start_codon:yes stop_codon:yes gene_type:complete